MISQAVYEVKRRYGRHIILRVPTLTTVDYVTGERVREFDEVVIRRAALLPANISSFSNPLLQLAQGKGDHTKLQRFLILDGKDMRKLKPRLRYTTTFDDHEWVVDKIMTVQENVAYMVTLLMEDASA